MWEYRDLVDSKRWEPDTSKEKYQDQPSLPKEYTVAIEHSINKDLNQVDFKSFRSGNGSGSGRGSSDKSDITCHKCGKRSHFPLTCSLSGYGPFYHTCDKLYLTCQMTLFQSHYNFHCSGSWNHPDSKPCWLNVQWPQCMPLEVKVGLETFLCL